jgi:hypothetical protein
VCEMRRKEDDHSGGRMGRDEGQRGGDDGDVGVRWEKPEGWRPLSNPRERGDSIESPCGIIEVWVTRAGDDRREMGRDGSSRREMSLGRWERNLRDGWCKCHEVHSKRG